MTRYARRTDGNHAEIKRGLEGLGVVVKDLSRQGGGVNDLLCGARGRWVLVEIKDPNQPPSKRRLTPAQTEFHALCSQRGLPCAVAETLDEAVDAVFERQRSAK